MRCRLILPAALALAACAGADGAGGAWEGRHLNELIHAWGPPSAVQRLADGRQVVTFTQSHDAGPKSAEDLGGGVTVVHGSGSYQCQAVFRIDSGGRIMDQTVDGTVDGCDRLFGGKPGPAR